MRGIVIKRMALLCLMITMFMLHTGCSFSWLPSNEKVVDLVENYYLFFHGGEKVEARVIDRGEFIKECECYPVKLKIILSSKRDDNKIFYFYKNASGEVSVRKFFNVKTGLPPV